MNEQFVCPYVRIAHPATLRAYVVSRTDALAADLMHTVIIGEPTVHGQPTWLPDRLGLSLNSTKLHEPRSSVQNMIERGELIPPAALSLRPGTLAGHPALLGASASGTSGDFVAYAIAEGYLRVARWSRPATDPDQRALLESIVFLDPHAEDGAAT